VALKQILDHHADDPVSRQRFLIEAKITGGLEHPGIVPVYGLGSYGDGRPYYAMRFIKGDSLKEAIEHFHADESLKNNFGRRSLELRKLLRRFTDVCNAIDYAHSRGVLHRDIKPGNIIVGKHGETLVVDWGLAKATGKADPSADERTLMPTSASDRAETLPGSALGTPAFMSPEQATGDLDRLGHGSDVYSLGATLYCLLSGRPPFASDEVGAILRAVQRGEFPPPRHLDPSINKALEAVCLKAMALRPEDRYGTCRALADDIERWMADEPVTAFQENFGHRLGRWAKRHRAWVRAGVVALLVVAMVTTTAAILVNVALGRERQARVGESAVRREAEHNFQAARQAVDESFTLVSEETLLDEPGLQPLRQKLLQSALAYHERFVKDHGEDRNLRRELARSRLRLADITGELGRREEALAHYQACRPWFEALVRDDPTDVDSLKGLVKCLIDSAGVQTDLSNFDLAEDLLNEVLRLLKSPKDVDLKASLARAWYIKGRLAGIRGNKDQERRAGDRAVKLQEELVEQHPERKRFQVDLSFVYLNFSGTMLAPSLRAEAIRMCRRAREIEEGMLRSNPDSVLHHYNLGLAWYGLGHQEMLAQRWVEATVVLDSARVELERVVQQNPAVRSYRLKLAQACEKLGYVQRHAGAPADSAIRSLERAAGLFQELHHQDERDLIALSGLGTCVDDLGEALCRAGRVDEAIGWFRKSVEIAGELHSRSRDDIFALAEHSAAYANLGESLATGGRHEEAVSSYRKAIEVIRKGSGDSTNLGHFAEDVSDYFLQLAVSLHELNRPDEVKAALSYYRKLSGSARTGLYKVACRLSLKIKEVGKGQVSLSPDQESQRRRYAETAMFWLREAVRAGWNDAPRTSRDPNLAPLRDRDDFRLLLLDLAFPAEPFAR